MTQNAKKISVATPTRQAGSWFDLVSRRQRKRRRTRERTGRLMVEVVDETSGSIPFESFDLSTSGIYLRSELLFEPGEQLQILLYLPFMDDPIAVQGEVVRVQPNLTRLPPGMGVVFTNLGCDQKRALETYVERLGKKS